MADECGEYEQLLTMREGVMVSLFSLLSIDSSLLVEFSVIPTMESFVLLFSHDDDVYISA